MEKDLTKQIYKDSGWQIDQDTKTTDYKPAPYCIFGEANAGKVPVGTEDGLIEFKDYNGGSPTPTELPITYYETYDDSKLIEGYLTYFNSGAYRGLWYKNQNGQTKKVFTIGEYPEGYITNVNVNTGDNSLNIFRQDLPAINYKATVSIGSYNYIDTSTHVISGRAELNWWLIIPKSSFESRENILNIRSVKATATSTSGDVDLSASSIVSVWKLVDATSLPEAQAIDPNATIGDLMVLLDVRNTSSAQVTVNNVAFVIQII